MGFLTTVLDVLDKASEAAKPILGASSLMQMSEPSGMTHLSVLVPQLVEDDNMNLFLQELRRRQWDANSTQEERQKAATFAAHAAAIARSI
jgi:hypothetical protein